jgi:hypothetical protein
MRLTLREALASDRLDAFVREQQDDGAELATGSELERGLALLVTRRRLLAAEGELMLSTVWSTRLPDGQVPANAPQLLANGCVG